MLSLPILLFVVLSFFPSLLILTFYFSNILTGGLSKRTFYRSAFVISLSGLAIGAAFALAAPFLPTRIPLMDVGVVLAVIAWVFLLRHFCGTGLLESLPPAIVATIIYVVILAIASGFTLLLLQG